MTETEAPEVISPDPWAHAKPPTHLPGTSAPFVALTCEERDSLFRRLGGAEHLTIQRTPRYRGVGPYTTHWLKDDRPVLLDTVSAGVCWHHAIEEGP